MQTNIYGVHQMEYEELIRGFLKQGYKPEFFSPSPPSHKALILRHDVDFDVNYAFELSKIEDDLGVKSTYFFLLRSKSYNLFERTHVKQVKSIYARGHHVSIHFDPTLYEDVEAGFKKEKRLFEMIFDIEVQYISIHRPSDYFLNNDNAICGVKHTYQSVYFQEITYFSDSQGVFRYGHPFKSQQFKNKESIQLLIHPIWWVTKAKNPILKLQEVLNDRIDNFKKHMASNCMPYKKYLEEKL